MSGIDHVQVEGEVSWRTRHAAGDVVRKGLGAPARALRRCRVVRTLVSGAALNENAAIIDSDRVQSIRLSARGMSSLLLINVLA